VIACLKPYAKIKDSGVEWLGEVPDHWEVVPNRVLFDEVKDRDWPNEEMLSVTIRKGVVRQADLLADSSQKDSSNLDRSNYKLVQRGDVVYNKMRAWQGAIGVSPYRGIVSPAYVIQCPRENGRPRYFHHLFRSPAFAREAERWSYGITSDMWSLRPQHFKLIQTCLPPASEQDAIVRFIDYVDRRIRRYIRAKRRLIKLLEEQKQALIHQAVTGQIDVRTGKPYPAYKSSGIEWLGEVPEHWRVTRVKAEFLCLNSRRIPLSSSERGKMMARRYDYYGASGVIDKVDNYLFEDELLLIAEDGANLVLRNLPLAIIARGKFWVNNHAHILKPRRGNIEYLAAVMERLDYKPWISGAAQPKLTKDRIMAIAIAVPSPEEQDTIMQWANAETRSIRSGITRANREIDLLNEYRTRLIADVVTGKLDVREAAASLSEKSQEPEVGDDEVDEDDEQDLHDDQEEDGQEDADE
jgi:type I restriction enzyme, S subunit